MTKYSCFVVILKFYYLLHTSVSKHDLLHLQLLNKKCYNVFVPQVFTLLKLNFETPPARLLSFEDDLIQ